VADIIIYTAVPCGYCMAAKQFFDARGLAYSEIDLTGDTPKRLKLLERTGQRTVPQIFIGETHVGGYTDLRDLERQGDLTALLEAG